jgi:23S rRNA pseudouridine2605 synthase
MRYLLGPVPENAVSQPSEDSPRDSAPAAGTAVRLNKLLAERGIASRRKCDELIAAGKVAVDGRTVSELGAKVDPDRQRIEVEGVRLEPRPRRRYYLLNKPRGVVCTNEGREARLRAIDLIEDPQAGRLYTVGRLDEDSEGLILVTNDGAFAQRVAHPRYGVEKTYLAKIRGRMEGEALERVRAGVRLAEGRTAGARIRVIKRTNQFTLIAITLSEGMNREVRRTFAQVGYKVLRLKRVAIGRLRDPRLKEGQWRPLLKAEVLELVGQAPDAPPSPKRSGRAERALGRRRAPPSAQRRWLRSARRGPRRGPEDRRKST